MNKLYKLLDKLNITNRKKNDLINAIDYLKYDNVNNLKVIKIEENITFRQDGKLYINGLDYSRYSIIINNYNHKINDYTINIEIKLNNVIYVFKNPIVINNYVYYPILNYKINTNTTPAIINFYLVMYVERSNLKIILCSDVEQSTTN